MALTSGVIPYEYIVVGPFSAETHAPGNKVGPSGVLFEQAAWVLLAELRRYAGSGLFDSGIIAGNPFLNNSPDRLNPDNQVYEPGTNGETLGIQVNPALLLNSTNIGSIRELMQLLFFGSFGTVGLGATVGEDWFLETFKNHPRGTAINPFFTKDVFAHPVSELGTSSEGKLVLDPQNTEDAFFSGDPYFPLGSSGILYDIDVAELMYQPWPRLTNNAFSSAGGLFGGESSPIFPQFQTTAGGLIAFSNGGGGGVFLQGGDYSVRGDLLVSNTEILITTTNDFSASNLDATLSFVLPGLAPLPAFEKYDSTIAEASYTPVALSSDTYRIASRLEKSFNVNLVIPSGIRSSVWPSIAQNTDQGLHVFNDGIFIEYPGGASIMSPLTDTIKHSCLAESNISDPFWRDLRGVARSDDDILVKMSQVVHQTAFDSTTGFQTVTLGTASYDDVVNRTSSTSGSVVLPTVDPSLTPSPPYSNPDGIFPDGLIEFSDCFGFLGTDGAGGSVTANVYLIEDGSNRVHAFENTTLAYDHTLHSNFFTNPHGAGLGSDIWTFGDQGDNRLDNITSSVVGGIPTIRKPLDVATNFPGLSTTSIIIHSGFDATDVTHEDAGLYLLWSANVGGSTRAYHLSRVTEEATTFEVQEVLMSANTATAIRLDTGIWHRQI